MFLNCPTGDDDVDDDDNFKLIIEDDFDFNIPNEIQYIIEKSKKLRPNLAMRDSQCFTIVRRHLVCTYQHGSHEDWKV